MDWLPYIPLGLIAVFLGLQVWFWTRTRSLQGRPAPDYRDLVDPETAARSRLLFYFYSSHCGPCRAMTPKVDALRQAGASVVMVDVGGDGELTCRFGVTAVPSFILVEEGRITRARMGRQSEHALRALAG